MDDANLALWITAIATIGLAIATLLLALVASFQDKIRAWLLRPQLKVALKLSPPDCHRTTIAAGPPGSGAIQADCYYFRLRVSNTGNYPATDVEVYACELHQLTEDGSWSKVDHFLPMSLKWSHIAQSQMPIIHRGMDKLCDIGHIIDPSLRPHFLLDQPPAALLRDPALAGKTTLSLDLEVIPYTFSHILLPGTYRLKLIVGSTETPPVTKLLQIRMIGTWHQNEPVFLGPCTSMSIVEPDVA